MPGKIRIGVIFGGRSGEHEVSLVSAKAISENLDKEKYEIIPIGITKEGQWLTGKESLKALKSGKLNELAPLHLKPEPEKQIAFDVAFPILHGTYGEDGTIQGFFELANIPYVGCGVLASSCAMDKITSKALFAGAGLTVVPFVSFTRKQWEKDEKKITKSIEGEIGLPCFVKPANLGSSVGISKVSVVEELKKAVELAGKFDSKILVEKGINAREIEIAILGNDLPQASVPGEIIPGNDFYDFNAKYIQDNSQTLIPADLSPELTKKIREAGIAAFKALDCSGMARVDFLLEKNSNTLYINEINTIPGFTSISMYPKLFEASGIPYPVLLDKLIEFAIERHEEKSKNYTGFNSGSNWYQK